ncbi:MAG: tetratricopeptide repeat protein [Candidatus Poribacteria bacterium]|nr:tetratricopeptide repeat protein [Candidatus Poribacteria bacterium]
MSKVLSRAIPLFLIASLLFFCSFTVTAEAHLLSLGERLFTQGNYDAAITEYKRFLFFHPDDERMGEVYHNIGLAYRAQGLWTEAVTALRIAIHHAADDASKSEYQLTLAVTLIVMQDYDLAQLELIKVTLRSPSALLYRRALFLRAVAYIYQFRWDEAREVLKNWSTDERLDKLFNAAINTPQKSVSVARILSTILPGAGQIYAGNWRSGLNALFLNGAVGFLTVDAALDGYYSDALLWGGLVFWRYYRGNTFRAGETAEQFNQQHTQEAAEAILQQLQEIVDTP